MLCVFKGLCDYSICSLCFGMATFLEAVGGFSGTVVGVNKRRCVTSSSLSSCQMNRITSSMSMPKVISDDCFKGFISGGNAVLPLYRGLRMCLPRKPVEAATTSHSSRVSKETVSEAQETITAAGVVNQATFQKLVLDSDIPVLVDFWAPWCGPCRMIAPLIDELARQYAGKLKCLKLNTDDSPDIATEYGIRSIPTVMIFVAGEKKDTVIGAVPKSTLTTTIEKYLDW